MYMKMTPFCIAIFVLFTVMRNILFYNYIIEVVKFIDIDI